MNTPNNEAAHYAALAQRVTGLEDGMKSVVSAVNGLADKLDRRGQTPWGVIASFGGVSVGVLGLIGGLAYRPIDQGMSKLQEEIKVTQSQLVSRPEHQRNWSLLDRDMDRMERRLLRL